MLRGSTLMRTRTCVLPEAPACAAPLPWKAAAATGGNCTTSRRVSGRKVAYTGPHMPPATMLHVLILTMHEA